MFRTSSPRQDVLNKIQMNIKYNILPLFAAVSLLTACSDDDIDRVYTVGEADNAIVLRAGVNEGGAGVETRSRDGNHTKHLAFKKYTQIALRIDGAWTGHSPEAISQQTIATIGDVVSDTDGKHNSLSGYNPVRYWDDYGTADPANVGTPENPKGRETGLTIYGIGVDGVTTAPNMEANDSWTNFSWSVCSSDEANGTATPKVIDQATNGWANYDLLTSNNIHEEETNKDYDGTYKFDNYLSDKNNGTNNSSNILEFTHAMTKITVVLTAGEGFPMTNAGDATSAHFEAAPTVTLEGFNYTGSVSVEAKTSTPTDNTTANIKMHLKDGGTAHTATFDALVFPGNTFSATIADDKFTPTSSDNILELNADGNIYKVTAAQLVKAIVGTSKKGEEVQGTLEQGKNYILNIKVNKTDLDITATILDWKTVIAEEEAPKINVTSTYGYTVEQGGTGVSAFTNDYDLFRSTVKATGYDEDNDNSNGITPAARYASSSWDKAIYWPDHQTHYFFRGVYPKVGTAVSGTTALTTAEAVTTVSSNDVIAVANSTYTTATYPSDLAIAIPRNTDGTYDETCKETGHTATKGICATEGVINMNFEYAMSKVEVRLKSSATDASHIAMTKDNTKIEIIGGYSKARIKLSDGLHDTYADADKVDYTLSNLTTSESGFLVTTRDAIVPQVIGDNVIFRVTVTDNNNTPGDTSDDTTDVYECKVNLINVKDTTTPVTEWEHGKHYIYELDVNKTAINVTATLKDWVTVTASDTVWF